MDINQLMALFSGLQGGQSVQQAQNPILMALRSMIPNAFNQQSPLLPVPPAQRQQSIQGAAQALQPTVVTPETIKTGIARTDTIQPDDPMYNNPSWTPPKLSTPIAPRHSFEPWSNYPGGYDAWINKKTSVETQPFGKVSTLPK